MKVAARILVGLVALFFVVWGLRFYFMPSAMAGEFLIAPTDAGGWSTLRGDLGGLFIAVGVFAALGLRPGYARRLWTAATIVGAVAFGRLIGFVADGPTATTVVPFVAELVFIAILAFGARTLRGDPAPTSV
jgi:hypothetical protein